MTDQHRATPEQQARDMLERMGVPNAQSYTSGNLVELANLIADSQCRPAPEQDATTWRFIEEHDIDPVHVCILELRARVEALEKMRSSTIDRMTERAILAGDPDAAEDLLQRRRAADSLPVDALVWRVMCALSNAGPNLESQARAAVREAAAWLEERSRGRSPGGLLLRDEANR